MKRNLRFSRFRKLTGFKWALLLLPVLAIGQTTDSKLIVQSPFMVLKSGDFLLFDKDQKLSIGNSVWDISENRLIFNGSRDGTAIYEQGYYGVRQILEGKDQVVCATQGNNNEIIIQYFDLNTTKKLEEKTIELQQKNPKSTIYYLTNGNLAYPYLFIREDYVDKAVNRSQWFYLYDISKPVPQLVKTITNQKDEYIYEDFLNPSGEFLFLGRHGPDDSAFLEVLQLSSLTVKTKIPLKERFSHQFLPSKNWLFINWEIEGVSIWNYETDQLVSEYSSENTFELLSIAPGGQYFVGIERREYTGDEAPPIVKVVEVATGKVICSFDNQNFEVGAKNPKADQVLEDRYEGELKYRNIQSLSLDQYNMNFSSDGRYLTIIGRWQGLPMHRVIDVKQKKILSQRLLPFSEMDYITGAKISTVKDQLFLSIQGNYPAENRTFVLVGIYDLQPPFDYHYLGQDLKDKDFAKDPKAYLQREPWDGLVSVIINPTGKYMVGSYTDGKVKVWDGRNSELIHTLDLDVKIAGPKSSFTWNMAISPSGKFLCFWEITGTRAVQIWEVEMGKKVKEINSSGRILQIHFSIDDQTLMISGGVSNLETACYDLKTFKLIEQGDRLEMMRKYKGVELGLYRGQSLFGFTDELPLTFRNQRVFVKGGAPKKNWMLVTDDGRFYAQKEDLPFIHRMKGDKIEKLSQKDDAFVEGFLYEVVNDVKEDHNVKFRRNFALLFAAEDYEQGWAKLNNPVFDTEALAKVLHDRYDFVVEVVKNPDQKTIQQKLREYHKKTYAQYDQLLVFFSGHGQQDPDYLEEGYLVPIDAGNDAESVDRCISHQDLFKQVDRIPCPHILLVADACYSGRMAKFGLAPEQEAFIDRRLPQFVEQNDIQYIQQKLGFTSRFFLASGNDAVPDGRPGTHTPFMAALLKALEKNRGDDRIFPFGIIPQEMGGEANKGVNFGSFGKGEKDGVILMEIKNFN